MYAPFLAPNSRPIQENHSRSVRTNIYYPSSSVVTSFKSGVTGTGISARYGFTLNINNNNFCPQVFWTQHVDLRSKWKPKLAKLYEISNLIWFLFRSEIHLLSKIIDFTRSFLGFLLGRFVILDFVLLQDSSKILSKYLIFVNHQYYRTRQV